ncbi:hypothetical protein NECID01_1322 [Nematocida sp. AWRm77]|nr:hypothetical protein NECID01_1322 [Nematocida sp. AWRm77]
MQSSNDLYPSKEAGTSLDAIHTDMYKLLSLFYSGVGIIQRDAPGEEREDKARAEALNAQIAEISSEFVQARDRLLQRVEELESKEKKKEKVSIEELLKETRELDAELKARIELFEKELPRFKEHVDKLIRDSVAL